MDNSPLNKELIAETRYHQLALRLSHKALDVMIYNPMEENSLVIRHFSLPQEADERLKSIENIIYDNPLLLGEYQKTFITVDTNRFTIIPSEVTDPDTQLKLLRAAHPDIDERFEMIAETNEGYGATFLTAVPLGEINFIRRTFNNAPIRSALALFARYCNSLLSKGHSVKAFANIHDDTADIVVASDSVLYLANRFSYRDPDDMVYYLMACTDPKSGVDVEELLLTGVKETRERLITTLRRFRPYVMPMIFPSAMYRAGAKAMEAPFDLIILPLCE